MNSKLLTIISLALTGISIIVAILSLIMVMNISKSISAPAAQEETAGEDGHIPLSETSNFLLEDAIVAVLPSETDPNTTMSVSITVGFRLDNNKEESVDVLALMETNSDIIKDRITKLIKTKSAEFMEEQGSDIKLQTEILELMKLELETDTIVEVYFKDSLQSKKTI